MGLLARNMAALLGGAALSILLGMHASHAQEAQTNDAETKERVTVLKKVVVTDGGGEEAAPEDIPASVSKIDARIIETFGRENLDDVIRSVPGTFTRENPQQPGVAVNIRGFEGSGRVTSMIDGVRQNFRFTGHEASGFTYIDPNFLTGIDISRGAVSTTGGGGLAGSVNFRTLGVDDVIREGQKYGILGILSAGSNGAGVSGMTAGGIREGSAGVIGAISGRDTDDYKNGDGVTVPDTRQNLKSGLFKAEFGRGEEHQLSLGGIYYNNDFLANSYNQTITNRTLTANYRFDPSDSDLIDLKVNAYYNDLDMDYGTNATGGGSAAGRQINDRGTGFDVSNTSVASFGEVGLVSVNGVEYFHDKVTGTNTGVNPAAGTSWTGGVFTENTFSYGIFDLVAALRYDWYGLNGSLDAPSGPVMPYDLDVSDGSLNPKLTLAAQVTDWFQPFVTYSHTMRPPTLQETMLGGEHPGVGFVSMIPNPDLKPEKQRGWEIGANFKRNGLFTEGDAFTAKASYFDMRIEDFVSSRTHPVLGMMQFVNLPGTTHQRGFELAADYDMGSFFGGIAYTHIDTDLPSVQPGLGALSYLPDDVVSLTLGGRFFDERLTAGARINYVSNTLGFDFAEPVNVTDESGYTLVDLFANYKFNESVEVAFKVTNLFDEQYTPALSTTGSGPGRTFHVSTRFQF